MNTLGAQGQPGGSGGPHCGGWVPTTELAVGKSAPDACLRSAPKLTFLNYSKTRSQFIHATVEVARRLSYSSTQRLDSPTLAQSTLRGFPDQRNEHTCDEIIYDRQQDHYQDIQRARTAVRNRTGVQGVRPRVDDDIVSSSQEYIKLAA